jgi:hypothetical protein
LSGSRAIVIVMALSVAATGMSSGGKANASHGQRDGLCRCDDREGPIITRKRTGRRTLDLDLCTPMGAAFPASTTLPVTVRVCASAEVLASTVAARTYNHLYFIGLLGERHACQDGVEVRWCGDNA